MNLKNIILIILFSIFFKGMFGQVPIQRDASGNITNLSQMKVTKALTDIKIDGVDPNSGRIDYSQIKGSPFWNNNWMKAFLFDQRDTFLGSYSAKFNFATNEVHFINKNGLEQAVIPGSLNAVVFIRTDDTTQTETVFKTNIPEVKRRAGCKDCFIQELNNGELKLLKITQRLLKTKDSLFGTLKTYYFYDETEYFIQNGELYQRVKRLNKDAVFAFVPGASAYNDWIKEKGLRFNKEEDYLVFFNHYNSSRKKE